MCGNTVALRGGVSAHTLTLKVVSAQAEGGG